MLWMRKRTGRTRPGGMGVWNECLTRFERLEADMGFSGGRLTGWDAAAPGSTGGEIPSGFVRGESTRLRVIVVSHVFPGLCSPGSYLSGFPKKVSARWR